MRTALAFALAAALTTPAYAADALAMYLAAAPACRCGPACICANCVSCPTGCVAGCPCRALVSSRSVEDAPVGYVWDCNAVRCRLVRVAPATARPDALAAYLGATPVMSVRVAAPRVAVRMAARTGRRARRGDRRQQRQQYRMSVRAYVI